jgi:MFS family permease
LLTLRPNDLLLDRTYRRLWVSILISSFGGQITLLAIPLTAAVLLHATPTEMGALTAIEVSAFLLFSLPAGVWLDRVRKVPVYVAGETIMALGVASVAAAYWLDLLTMRWLYVVGFLIGIVHTVAGTAAQIVLTQIVPRERLVEAHAKNALANSTAEVAGPGAAGALIRVFGAPFALVADALLLAVSALILRGLRIHEELAAVPTGFVSSLRTGLGFVTGTPLLVTMAVCVGIWQLGHHAAVVVQILYATRTLGLDPGSVGLAYVALGCGTVLTALFGNRIVRRIGPGPGLVAGFAVCGTGWLLAAAAPAGTAGLVAFVAMLTLFGAGGSLVFINFLALRQSVTPAPLLGRMTSTMRWLILLPAGPGALLGGYIGEHVGLRATLAFAGVTTLAMAAIAWRQPLLRSLRTLPQPAAAPVPRDPVQVAESQPGEYSP